MHLDSILKRARHFITLKELYNDIWLLLSVLEKHTNGTAGLTVFLCDIPLYHHAILFILSNLSMVFCWTVFSVISSTSIYGKQVHAWVYILFSCCIPFICSITLAIKKNRAQAPVSPVQKLM